MSIAGRLAVVVLGLVTASGPGAALVSQQQMEAAYDRGIAHAGAGWVASGTDVLATLDDSLTTTRRLDGAIPRAWAQRGFDRIGDVDVAGDTLYVPFGREGSGQQAMARYDAATLAWMEALYHARFDAGRDTDLATREEAEACIERLTKALPASAPIWTIASDIYTQGSLAVGGSADVDME